MENLKEKMVEAGYTAKELAELFNVNYSTVCSNFKGNRLSKCHKATYKYFLLCRDKGIGKINSLSLKRLMKSNNLTQRELSNKLGCTRSTISNHINCIYPISDFNNARYWYFFKYLEEKTL